ncbi:hypothetical protein GOV05_05565 [Candidatus Woesearchaeota archaeon]|nr:hypothetical protein [Candidatus Woesearchaeota archaeon]
MVLSRFLTDSKPVFFLSVFLGFILPHGASILKPLVVPLVALMMTISVKDIAFHHIKKSQIKNITRLTIINYFLLTGLFILLTLLFVKNPEYQKAMIVLAMMPPAVGIISLTYILNGDTEISFITEFVCYALSILIIPILTLIFFKSTVQPLSILKIMVYVIIIPFILSRLIHYYEHKKKQLSKDVVKAVVNVSYAVSFYIVIGLNRDVVLSSFSKIIPIILILFFLKFVVGTLVYHALRNKMEKRLDVVYVLFSTFKNGGASVAITILLFGVGATLPLAINSIMVPPYIIYLEWLIPDKTHKV